MNEDLHPAIVTAIKNYESTILSLRLVTHRVQKNCSHTKVLHVNTHYSTWVGPFYAARICLQCGFEEQLPSSHETFKVLTTEFVKKVDSHSDIWKHRIPEDFCPDQREWSRKKKTG